MSGVVSKYRSVSTRCRKNAKQCRPWSDLLLCWCFTALRHISGHFGFGQLTYPHCSWASLLGSLPVHSAHSFASNWQLPFLNQRKGENGRRNNFKTKLHERMLLYVRIEPTTIHIPGGRAFDRATVPGTLIRLLCLHIPICPNTWDIYNIKPLVQDLLP